MNFFGSKDNKNYNNSKGFNPKVLEVNLIKDEMGVVFDVRKHIISLIVMIIVSMGLVVEVYFGLDWWQKQEANDSLTTSQVYEQTKEDLRNINEKVSEVTDFKDKLSLIKLMADNHIYWSDFFNWLQLNTLNSVTYGDFSGSIDGEYSFSATTNNFRDISWQVKTLRDNKYVDSVSVDSGSGGTGDNQNSSSTSVISFDLNLKVKPEIFLR